MNMAGSLYQSRVDAKMMNYQARMADKAAGDIAVAGRAEERQQRLRTARTVGAQRAALGGAGVDVNTGSALDTQVETAGLGEMDALTIRSNWQNEAWTKKSDAAMYRAGAKTARTAGLFGAASSLLTGASRVAGAYSQFSNQQPTMEQKTKEMYEDYYKMPRRKTWDYVR
jgi:hypothetical protein